LIDSTLLPHIPDGGESNEILPRNPLNHKPATRGFPPQTGDGHSTTRKGDLDCGLEAQRRV
jgi:hypothetical protein